MRAAYLLPGLLVVSPARAEGDRAFSAALGWATFSTPGKAVGTMEAPAITPDYGAALGLIYEHSVSTDVALRGELAGHLFSGGAAKGQGDHSYVGLAGAAIEFRFDVLKYVPYAFGGIGGVWSSGGPIDRGGQFVVSVGGGLDVLAGRTRSWGFEGRLASFAGDVTVFSLGVRGSIRWGYF
jgi:hypothetical protein